MRQGRRRANVVMTKVIQQKMSQLLSSTRLLGLLALPVIMFNAQAEAPRQWLAWLMPRLRHPLQ